MGLFDSLLGLNSTDNLNRATGQANSLVNQTLTGTNADLNNSTGNAAYALQQGVGNASNAINTGYGNATGALTGYGQQAQGALQGGVNSAVNTVQGSNGQYAPYVAGGDAASGALSNALGLNGAAGNAAATDAFQGSPGYQYALDQSTGAAQRAAAAAGMNASGNTLSAIAQLGSNLGNQNYQQYVQNLQNEGSQGLTAANAVSGNNQAAGQYDYSGGALGANLLQQTGGALGTLDAAQGSALGNLQSGLGSGIAGLNTNLGASLTNNAWNGANAANQNTLALGKAQDSADNANNGIFSNLFKNGLSAAASFL